MKKILVGLSGGVDSAVAAYLLKQQGYEVTAGFMRNWDSLTNNDILGNPTLMDDICSQEQDYLDAKAVADKLGIELLRIDFVDEYWNKVFMTFLQEYEKGRTPNPDILCNEFIKFDSFFQYAMDNGFDGIATGHYVSQDDQALLKKAADKNKDQSYFLAQAPVRALEKTIFPLGELEKPQVRELARQLGLDSVSTKKDSTGICFIGERDFRAFLQNYLPAKPGKIIDVQTGQVLGEHPGVLYFTNGQRKGLNITAHAGPWFVVGKDVHKNELYVTHHTRKDWLLSDSARIVNMHWLVDPATLPKELMAKFRYRQPDQPVTLEAIEGDSILLGYRQGIPSVMPGQEAVLYLGDVVVGGGVIDQIFQKGEAVDERIQKHQRSLGR